MSNLFYTSDLHGGHKNIHKYRSMFESEEDHWETVKENYHRRVGKRDTVIFLGDVCFTQERLSDFATWPAGRKILILGNHDTERLEIKNLVGVFDEVHGMLKHREFWLTHAPLHPEELRGKINVHGHTHEHVIDDSRYVNVCLEHTNFAPISLSEVREIVRSRGL